LTQRDSALVVMATHSRSGPKRAIIGSIAGKIVQHANVPVVLLHPARPDDELTVPMASPEVSVR